MKNKYIIFSVLSLSLFLSACADFLDVNTDPTRLKTSSVALVLSAAETSLALHHGGDIFQYSSLFMQHATGNGVTGGQMRLYDQYILTNADVNNSWNAHYAGALADLEYIRQNTYKDGNPTYGGIAKVLQAYNFSTLVAAWGDIPYKEALAGSRIVQPKYDNSKEIYDSLFLLIDSGIADLAGTNVRNVGAEDLIYNGDLGKWTRFANTLKLRLALHYAKDDNGVKLNSILNTPGITFMANNSDNFQMAFEDVNNRQTPIDQFEVRRQDQYWPGKFLVDLMNAKADPRRTTYFTPSPYPATTSPYTPLITDSYVGFAPGAGQSIAASRVGTYLRGSLKSDDGTRTSGSLNALSLTYTGAAPLRMLTFAEYNFIRAEAAFVYGSPGSAATFFNNGIQASMDGAGLSGTASTQATTYRTTQTGLPLTLQQIIEEKYVASYGVIMEPWTDWRRTGFPVIPVSAAAISQGNTTIPRILVYPLSETQNNGKNVPERATIVVKGVFWDK